MNDYLEETYNSTFHAVYGELLARKQNDPGFTKDQLQELLQSLYINEGNNWIGMGEIKEASLAATIAACERLLCEWTEQPCS